MDADIKTPQDALEWLDRSIREEAELDGEMSNANAIRVGFIRNMLSRFPLRNCDVGTPEEQYERYRKRCGAQDCCDCPVRARWDFKQTGSESCQLVWAQMSYEEGGAK